MAAYRLGFTRAPAGYGDPAADETLAADVAAGEQPTGRMRDYLDARTRFFDRVVVGAIGRGVRQIVLGAAGYDGRAFRYAKRGVRWFEVDHPATQHDKQERLARLGLATRQVRYVPADFARDPVADRLTAVGLDPGQPSLFLLEGVAVYLEPAVLERVLRQFRQVAGSGSRLAISVSTASADGEARSRFRASLARLGEPGQIRPGRRPGHRAPRPYRLARHERPAMRRAATRTIRRPSPAASAAAQPACSSPPPPPPSLPQPQPPHPSQTPPPPQLHRRPRRHRPGRRPAALLQAVPPASAPPAAH